MQWLSRRRVGWLALVLVLIGVVSGVGYMRANRSASSLNPDDPHTAVLTDHNWTPQGEPSIVTVTLPPAEELPSAMEPPWSLYLQASQEIGLDFTRYAGQTLPSVSISLAVHHVKTQLFVAFC